MKHSGYRNFNICWRNLRITLKIVLLAHSFARIAVSPWPIQEWRLQGDLPPTMRLAVRAGVTLIHPRRGSVALWQKIWQLAGLRVNGDIAPRKREERVIRAACGFLRSFTQRPTPLPLVLLAAALTGRLR